MKSVYSYTSSSHFIINEGSPTTPLYIEPHVIFSYDCDYLVYLSANYNRNKLKVVVDFDVSKNANKLPLHTDTANKHLSNQHIKKSYVNIAPA